MSTHKYKREIIITPSSTSESTCVDVDSAYLTPILSATATCAHSFYSDIDHTLKKIEEQKNFKNFVKKKKRREFWK